MLLNPTAIERSPMAWEKYPKAVEEVPLTTHVVQEYFEERIVSSTWAFPATWRREEGESVPIPTFTSDLVVNRDELVELQSRRTEFPSEMERRPWERESV